MLVVAEVVVMVHLHLEVEQVAQEEAAMAEVSQLQQEIIQE
tara:strand:+ start:284 stop:406 length:123 start_codon:yes stop_codon:yes gene_type:complete